MYAKLLFTSGTTAWQAIRDITRLIDDSSSGSASLSNLEFIDTNSSDLYAGVNSGWALHSSYSLNSGSITTTDSHYVLQGTTATGSKAKYCSIQANGPWTSTSYSTTSTAIMFATVNSPGTAREDFCEGYNGSTTNRFNNCGSLPTTVHIWADPRKLVLYGTDGLGKASVHAMLEAAETASTTYYSLAPQGKFHWCNVGSSGTSYEWCYTRNSLWGNTFSFPYIKMCSSMYSYHPSWTGVVRNSGWHGVSPISTSTTYGYWAWGYASYLDDGTTASGVQNTTNGQGQSTDSINGQVPNIRFEQFGHGRYTYGHDQVGKNTLKHLDASGNKAIPLRPIVWDWPQWSAEIYNFSNTSGIYWAPGGMGSSLDTVTVGSDVYHYVDYALYSSSALMIKRI